MFPAFLRQLHFGHLREHDGFLRQCPQHRVEAVILAEQALPFEAHALHCTPQLHSSWTRSSSRDVRNHTPESYAAPPALRIGSQLRVAVLIRSLESHLVALSFRWELLGRSAGVLLG